MVRYCDCWMSVVRRPPLKIHSKDISTILLNLAGIILTWLSLIIVQMVPVHCISRSQRLKKFQDENLKNLLV